MISLFIYLIFIYINFIIQVQTKRTLEPTKNLLITTKIHKNKHKAETLKLVRIGTKLAATPSLVFVLKSRFYKWRALIGQRFDRLSRS